MLYERHNYVDKDIDFIVSQEIVEYDLKSAGFNLLKTFKVIDTKTIEYLESLPKKQRQIKIGLMQRSDKELAKKLNKCFIEARKRFFELNNIKDDQVISIKKDAIFTTRRCLNCKVGEFLIFDEKNMYTSYYLLNNYEFYFNKDKTDVKGISDEKLLNHREYVLEFLHHFFLLNETSDIKTVSRFVNDFIHYYKSKQLNINYYRELNSQSLFRLNDTLLGESIGADVINDKNYVDIGYNYFNYIVPILSMLI